MDKVWKEWGWSQIRQASDESNDFALLAKQVALYNNIINTEAWKDYQYRLGQIREATRKAIEVGGLDKWGHRHDDEQRAALYLLDQLISYVPTIYEMHDRLTKIAAADESLANRPLYGDDYIANLTNDIY